MKAVAAAGGWENGGCGWLGRGYDPGIGWGYEPGAVLTAKSWNGISGRTWTGTGCGYWPGIWNWGWTWPGTWARFGIKRGAWPGKLGPMFSIAFSWLDKSTETPWKYKNLLVEKLTCCSLPYLVLWTLYLDLTFYSAFDFKFYYSNFVFRVKCGSSLLN